MRRVLGLLVAVALTAACSSGKTESAEPPATVAVTTTPSTTTEATTTTTTTAAPAVRSFASGPDPKVILTTTGITAPVVGREGDALLIGTPCGFSTPVKEGTPVDGIVVLDAGHGGEEPGAVGPGGLTEKELNLAVTKQTKQALEAQGVTVVLTRTADYRITLEARAKIVTTLKPKAFVSIHHNAEPDGPRPQGPGTETYYQTAGDSSAQSKRLAGLVYEEVVKALSQYQGTPWVADTDAGAKYRKSSSGDDYYGIIRRTHGTPSALAELGFLTNAPEEALYAKPEVQKVEGEAVARGIKRFLDTNDPGSGFTEPYPRETPAGGGGGASNCHDPAM